MAKEAQSSVRHGSVDTTVMTMQADNVPPFTQDEKGHVISLGEAESGPERNSTSSDGYVHPTEHELTTLRKVAGNMPLVSYSLCLVEFAERASYYGAKTVFNNFIQFPLPKGGNGAGAPPRHTQQTAGALGMGLQAASGLTLFFLFIAYVIPIFGGWWADNHVGRYKAIVIGVLICGVAHLIQIFGALPSVLQKGKSHAAPPFLIGLVLLAIGAGIFKPNIAPTVLDQNRQQKAWVKTLKSGERVIVDPEATAGRTMMLFYAAVNVGAFFMLATTYSEKYVGYWLSFTESGAIYFILPLVLWLISSRTYKAPLQKNSTLKHTCQVIGIALRRNKFRVWRKGFWDAARPSVLAQEGKIVPWTDKFVTDVQRTVAATEIFCYFPIWSINDGGIGGVSTNQGASMITNGAPNDVLNNFNALTIIVAAPILTYFVYPLLRRLKMEPGRITRIAFGFFLSIVSSIIAAIIQWRIYKTSPCGYYASTCDSVAPISIWWQIPNQSLGALSECFCNVTGYELAYARSPPEMRGLVVAIFLLMQALAAALGEVTVPVTKDPYLIYIWAAPAVAMGILLVVFWFRFKDLNDDEFILEENARMEERHTSESEASTHREEKKL